MKPTCFGCHATMKVVYVRVNQVCVRIEDYYHCDKCKRTRRVGEKDIMITNIIAKNGILSLVRKSIKYSLNLRIHQYKLDFWVNNRKKAIIELCQKYILAQAGAEKWIDIIKPESWHIKFKANGLVDLILADEETFRVYKPKVNNL